MSEGVRLQKVLAQAGVASRRAAEQLIDQGRVEVNGQVVDHQGMRVDPIHDLIRVDGQRVTSGGEHVYLALNKPAGVVSTMSDPQGRPSLADYVPEGQRLFHVGRLDTDTSGLLLLTNDGDFAQKVSHPSHEVRKRYVAQVRGEVGNETLRRLRQGLELDDGPVRPDEVRLMQRHAGKTLLSVTLHEGRNRIVRRLFDAVGHPVLLLTRTDVGPVSLAGLKAGKLRPLTLAELGQFLDLLDAEPGAESLPDTV
ncbi:MAG: rRNA pseudouridine synthase [Propionibacteriaceae bacterium]|jgi:23S rRNA pseudouridine2605 synthase|nr:rRNA pseudouridine synthase [Propionibacteriaceae bacterium]